MTGEGQGQGQAETKAAEVHRHTTNSCRCKSKCISSSISSTEAQVKSAEQTAEATLARYRAGFGTILDLITAQQDETNARTQRIQSYLDWYTVLARLNLSLGASNLIPTKSENK